MIADRPVESGLESIPEGHPAAIVSDIIDSLDVSTLIHEPEAAAIVKAVIFAYAQDRLSSRWIDRACGQLVVFRSLASGKRPGFYAISGLRSQYADELKEIFLQVLLTCQQLPMPRLGKMRLYEGQENRPISSDRLRQSVSMLLERAHHLDAAEIFETPPQKDGDVAPTVSRRTRRVRRIREARRELLRLGLTRHLDALRKAPPTVTPPQPVPAAPVVEAAKPERPRRKKRIKPAPQPVVAVKRFWSNWPTYLVGVGLACLFIGLGLLRIANSLIPEPSEDDPDAPLPPPPASMAQYETGGAVACSLGAIFLLGGLFGRQQSKTKGKRRRRPGSSRRVGGPSLRNGSSADPTDSDEAT